MVEILTMSAKISILNLLKIKVFLNKVYYVFVPVLDVKTKFFLITQILF